MELVEVGYGRTPNSNFSASVTSGRPYVPSNNPYEAAFGPIQEAATFRKYKNRTTGAKRKVGKK